MHLISILIALLPVVSGPDGRLQLSFQGDDGHLRYTLAYDGKTLLEPSLLGIQTNEVDYTRLEVVSVDSENIRDSYTIDRIKASRIDHPAVRAILHCQNPDGRKLDIEWHLTDNDAAFRYIIPRDSGTGSIRVLRETSYFRFPEGATGFLTPQSDAMIGWKRSKPSYEEHYTLDAPVDNKSQYGHGYTFPCLFRVGTDGWVMLSETGVDSRYCASHLSDWDAAEGYSIAFAMPDENNGNGTVDPAFALPGATPWRTITVGADLAPIVETTIPYDVVQPRYQSIHNYKYGKSTWSWIIWQDASMNHDDQVAYIDLASEMGYPYILIDAGWDREFGHEGMEKLIAYARSKGVEVFLWYSSSGWWNDIQQSPIDIMCDPLARKPEMHWLQSVGVRGIKVDFFGGDKQETMRLYEAILSDADDHGLMCIFHGATLPRGWERMYPNFVGSEAVLASENLVFGQLHCDLEAQNAALHPFLRNSVASMEYGGVVLNKRLSRENGTPDARGRVRGTERRTTDAAELAIAVLYQNPIQNFAITPNNLSDAPAEAIDFLREVPTTWDETRFVEGYPGRYIVLARRHGDRWYIGAINAQDEPVKVDLKAIEKRFGPLTGLLRTDKGALRSGLVKAKYLSIPRNDGAVLMTGEAPADARHLRFDFGSASAEPGYTPVTADNIYSAALGYGFEAGASISDVVRGKGTPLTRDFVTAAEPFRFSVRLPEGNYRVTLTLGDSEGESRTTVKSEVRRLMAESVPTAKGEIRTISFNVNIRTPELSSGNSVKLNSREWDALAGVVKTFTWDDKLTLQFYDSAPAVCAVEIEPAGDDVVTVFIIGDSTVTDQPSGGTWGQYLPRWFDDRVVVANHAESGMTIKGFRFMRRWDKIMESCKPGDYLLIQLGTNDEKARGHDAMWPAEDLAGDWVRTHADPEKDYIWGLATMALEAKRHGMIPVIVSPMTKIDRRSAEATELMTPYGINARHGAELGECAYIDLWGMSREIVSALGKDALAAYSDGTHTDNFGAYLFSLCIARGIRENGLSLKEFLLPDTPVFNPADPHPTLQEFSCPIEPRRAPQRPAQPMPAGQTEFGPL